MQKQAEKTKDRKGDTGRTSNQGRKLSSGGNIDEKEKGNPEVDENSKSPKAEVKKTEENK
jgi:hypothetical protein